jgi:hypothetical protein
MIKVTEQTKIDSNPQEKEILVTIDNGDLKLIDSLTEAYDFKDRNSLFKFAIATLLQGNNNEGIFTIKTEEGKRLLSKIDPSEDMLNSKENS